MIHKVSFLMVWILGILGIVWLSEWVSVEAAIHTLWILAVISAWNTCLVPFLPRNPPAKLDSAPIIKLK